MADQIYYSVFTKKGLELLTEAIQNGTKLGITSMAFGDGGGSLPVPNEAFTQLVNEVHRTQLNSLAPDPNNANWLRAEAIIASAVGGFNIRELGLYAGDVLVAYSNYPATYKPNPSDGTARIMTFRMVLQIDNTSNFDLVIDPDVVLATIQKLEDMKQEVKDITILKYTSINSLLADTNVWDGKRAKTLSYYEDKNKGAAEYYFDSSKSNINNGVTAINGWCLIFDDYFNVYQAGALCDEDFDDTDFFQKAIDATKLHRPNLVQETHISALVGQIEIPSGAKPKITRMLNTRGALIQYLCGLNVKIEGTEYLNGRLDRSAYRRSNLQPFGTGDTAVGDTVIVNNGDASAKSLGFPESYHIGMFAYRGYDQIGRYTEARASEPTLTALSVTYIDSFKFSIPRPSEEIINKLKKGMIVNTMHSVNWSAFLLNWEINNDELLITTNGFFKRNETFSSVPTSGFGLYINKIAAIWGHNTNLFIDSSSIDSNACGHELLINNNLKDDTLFPLMIDENGDYIYGSSGYYFGSFGQYKIQTGLWLRGLMQSGICIDELGGDITTALLIRTNAAKDTNFIHVVDDKNNNLLRVQRNQIEFGDVSEAEVAVLDFHSSGIANDYDARILVQGGNAESGKAELHIDSQAVYVNALSYGSSGVYDFAGDGDPEGIVSAKVGSTYRRSDGSAGTCFYIKESGDNTKNGWVAK